MDRREFLKVTGAGALTLFLSGCGRTEPGTKKRRDSMMIRASITG